MEPAEERQNLVADGSDESNGSDRTAGNGEAKSFAKVFVGQAGASFFFICCWFTASLTLSLYNKYLFSASHYNFKYPLFTTTMHTLIQFVLSYLVTLLMPSMAPTQSPTARQYFLRILPCGFATGVDIGLSNNSLRFVTLTFYTMVKSSAPVFVLLFAFIFRLETPTFKLCAIILVIVFGVYLMVSDETSFHLLGYILVQIATVCSGLRWALTQVLLKSDSMGMNGNPVATNLYLSPLMALSLFIASVFTERLDLIFASRFFSSLPDALWILGAIGFGGILAFFMLISEYMLINCTSVVTFSVAGIVKEVLTITVSSFIFGDRFTSRAGLGLLVSIGGIMWYNYYRTHEMWKNHVQESQSNLHLSLEDEAVAENFALEEMNPYTDSLDRIVI
ncbi:MAG: hypothetical protein SGCHY_002499 [Lobulomycetales sp.]